MIETEELKFVVMVPPQLKDDGDFASNTPVDTKGWARFDALMIMGTTDVAAGDAVGSTAEGTAPILEECDTSDGDYTEIDGAQLSDAIQFDDDNVMNMISVNLRNTTRKRYIELKAPHSAAGAANGSNMCVIGILSKGEVAPNTAALRGLAEHVIV